MLPSPKLSEFVAAQDPIYQEVRNELAQGRKQTHWMWFIFPQLKGLGSSAMAIKFGIDSLEEAKAYLQHPVLGPRLKECTELMLTVPHDDAHAILGSPDDLKFHSSMTLFSLAQPEEPIFQKTLEKFFKGERDARTLQLLKDQAA
jgi:uncharacterized protein (DUF1810 family)